MTQKLAATNGASVTVGEQKNNIFCALRALSYENYLKREKLEKLTFESKYFDVKI